MTTRQPYVQWKDSPISVQIRKPNGDMIDLSVGDLISVKQERSDRNIFFKIDEFVGDITQVGPVYFVYREFDTINKCFIEPSFSLKMGTKNYMICYPSGNSNYGYHLNKNEWSSIKICDAVPS
jgi:hypothetical protein